MLQNWVSFMPVPIDEQGFALGMETENSTPLARPPQQLNINCSWLLKNFKLTLRLSRAAALYPRVEPVTVDGSNAARLRHALAVNVLHVLQSLTLPPLARLQEVCNPKAPVAPPVPC